VIGHDHQGFVGSDFEILEGEVGQAVLDDLVTTTEWPRAASAA
jgi:hypothetical protein